jgi:hypothetical protein
MLLLLADDEEEDPECPEEDAEEVSATAASPVGVLAPCVASMVRLRAAEKRKRG